jgi:hypothetical protein
LRECCHLTVKHRRIPEVVPDARQRPAVTRQRNCGKWTSPRAKPPDELSREVTRLSGAPAIAEANNLSPALERLDDCPARSSRSRCQFFTAVRDYLLVSAEMFSEAVA